MGGITDLFSGIQNTLSGGANAATGSDLATATGALASTVNPNLQSLIPTLQLQVVQGTMTPAQAQAAIQQQSALMGIQLDPTTAQAQLTALSQMQQVAANGGLTPADKSQLLDIQQQLATQNAGEQGAIMQQAAQQGIAGSGTDLAARLSSAQQNETAGAQQGATVAANAQQRALAAMGNAGSLAQSMQGQQYSQAANTAASQNAINQFNAQNTQSTNLANQQATQQANAANYGMQNQVAGTNTGITNTQNMLPLQAAQQTFTNSLGTNTAIATAANAAAKTQQAQAAANTTGNSTGLGSVIQSAGGLGGIASTIGGFLGFAEGGDITGPGTPTSDSVPIAASNGEFVVNSKAADQYRPVLHAINSGACPEDVSDMLNTLTDGKYKMARGPDVVAESKPVVLHGEQARKAALATLSGLEKELKRK